MKAMLGCIVFVLLLLVSSFSYASPEGLTQAELDRTRFGQSKKARTLNLGRLQQASGPCNEEEADRCNVNLFSLVIIVPVLSAISLTALWGNIIALSIKKSRFAMGLSTIVLGAVGIIAGSLTTYLMNTGSIGYGLTFGLMVPFMAFGGITMYVGRKEAFVKRASLSPLFNVSKNGAVTGGLTMRGSF